MKNRALIFVFTIFSTALACGQSPAPLTSLAQIHTLTNEEAAKHIPVDFQATVTYFRNYEHTLFVQDGGAPIYVNAPSDVIAIPGDLIRIQGNTEGSFHPIVVAQKITVVGHGVLPTPVQAHFPDLSHARFDGMFVKVSARIISADLTISSDQSVTRFGLLIEGSPAEALVENSDPGPLREMLDADVEIDGVSSGRFDGKMQMTGITLHVQDLSHVKVLHKSVEDPWDVPLSTVAKSFEAFRANELSDRVRLEGVITYYYPGNAVVLQDGSRSIWINTHTRLPLHIGHWAEAIGFPDTHDGFLRLNNGEIKDTGKSREIQPTHTDWKHLSQSHYIFDIVSIDAKVVAEVREAARDTYVLSNEGHLFSAVYRHPEQQVFRSVPLPPLKEIPIGSTVRVTGICLVEDANPYNGSVPVDLMMRASDDIVVLARPSWVTVANLAKLIAFLCAVVLLAAVWVTLLRRRVRHQSLALAFRAEQEATHERRNAQIEQRRARVLEDINGNRPLAEILEDITAFVSFHLDGAPCWCDVQDGARLGNYQPETDSFRIVREDIPARVGPSLGSLFVALPASGGPSPLETQALLNGARLATLAIETRHLYSDLVHRSEFDMLTDIHNRFSLEKQLEDVIAKAREHAGMFGLIFIDLDEFKQVNDMYGHQVGDLYLQEVTARMKRQLRAGDLLARLGGDEFAALVPTARSRAEVDDIAERLRRCFDQPFLLGGHVLHGAASLGIALYPEDGSSSDSLLSAADAAMYVAKHCRRDSLARERSEIRSPIDSAS